MERESGIIGKNLKPWAVLAIHLLAVWLYHQYAYIGHYGFDDMEYARMAYDLLQGKPDWSNHFAHRLAITAPTALAYFIFGINDGASSLTSLIYTFLIGFLVTLILRKRKPIVVSMALSLSLLPPWFLFYSDKLMPDMAVAFYVLAAMAAYWFGTETAKPNTRLGVVFSMALFLGFLSKGTIILILPLAFFFSMRDLWKKRYFFWIYASSSGVMIAVAYLITMEKLTGSWRRRFDAIAENEYINACSYTDLPAKFLFRRVGYEFWEMGIAMGLLPGLIFLLALIFKNKLKKETDKLIAFLGVSSAILLLSSNFMSISLSRYNPMCIDVRHYLFIVPVLGMISALVLDRIRSSDKLRFHALAMALAFAPIAYMIDKDMALKLWAPLLGFIAWIVLVRSNRITVIVSPIILFFIMLIKPWDVVTYAKSVQYKEQRNLLSKMVRSLPHGSEVITDGVQARLATYYSGFDSTKVVFTRFTEMEGGRKDKTYLVLNPYTQYLSGIKKQDLPFCAKEPETCGVLIDRKENPELSIYRLDDVLLPRNSGFALFDVKEDFLETPSKLELDPDHFIDHEGRSGYKLGKYSATYRLPGADFPKTGKRVFALVDFDFYLEDESESRLVISIMEKGNEAFRKEYFLTDYSDVYGVWGRARTETELPDLRSEAELVVYFWRPDETSVMIDSLSISIKGLNL